MNPSGVIMKPEPFPLISRASRRTLTRCLMSMLTTAEATRATALTTVREYSSSRAESSRLPKAFRASASSPAGCASPPEFASFKRNFIDAVFSFERDAIVMTSNFESDKPPVNYTCFLPIQTLLNVTLRLHLKENCFTQKYAKSCFDRFGDGCAMHVPACARSDCG